MASLPPSTNVGAQPAQPGTPPRLSRPEELKGVGGWLLFFICTTLLFSALGMFRDVSAVFRELVTLHAQFPAIQGANLFDLMDYIAWGVVRGYGIFAGVQLAKTARGAVGTAKRYLVLYGMVAIVQYCGLLFLFGIGAPSAQSLTLGASDANYKTLLNSVRSFGYVILWWSYFNRSLRVKNTYATNVVPGA